MTLKWHVLLTEIRTWNQARISQSCIKTDYRNYKFFRKLDCNPQKLQGVSGAEIHLWRYEDLYKPIKIQLSYSVQAIFGNLEVFHFISSEDKCNSHCAPSSCAAISTTYSETQRKWLYSFYFPEKVRSVHPETMPEDFKLGRDTPVAYSLHDKPYYKELVQRIRAGEFWQGCYKLQVNLQQNTGLSTH